MKTKPLSVGVLSLGCPKNLVDSEVLLGLLKTHGYAVSLDVTDCDIALINTCAFVRDAKEESLQMIEEICRLKAEGAIKYLIVCGCLPQRYPKGYGTFMNEIDAYIGTGQIEKIPTVIETMLSGKKILECSGNTFLYSHETPRFYLTPSFVKYVKIAEGCNHKCSFCIIPEIRGPYVSRSMESIVTEVKQLADNGLKEAVIISQDTSYYGKDLYGEFRLPNLLHELSKISGLEWIRVLYMYPKHVSRELIDVMNSSPKICRYIDLALQHISEPILKSMRRGITKNEIKDVVYRLREGIPGLAMRTTFIVGYPGEGYHEFNELLDFVEEMRFERLGAFMYSPEEGTHAATLESSVSEDVKKSRFQDIMLLQQKISSQKNSQLVGKIFKTLLEGRNQDSPGYIIGRTYMDAPDIDGWVYVKDRAGLHEGDFYNVKITSSSNYDLFGEIV
jgi:ribosomal protein S12 methylthiotransferase